MTRRAYFIGSIEEYGSRVGLVLNFMKNNILVILRVKFLKFAHIGAPVGARTGFREQFEYFNEHTKGEPQRKQE